MRTITLEQPGRFVLATSLNKEGIDAEVRADQKEENPKVINVVIGQKP